MTCFACMLVATCVVCAIVGCAHDEGQPSTDESVQQAPVDANADSSTPTLPGQLHRPVMLIQQGQTESARNMIKQYLEGHPSDGLATFLLGLTYHEEFRYGKARPHFERAAELEPNYHPIHHFLGWCLYHLGDAEGARGAMKTHLEHMPEEGDSHYVIGLLDMEAGRFDEAEQRFRQAVQFQQNVPGREGTRANAHARIGQIMYQRGEWDEARDELETAVQLNPMHDEAWYHLYRLFVRIGDDEKAELARERHEQVSRQLQRETGFPE